MKILITCDSNYSNIYHTLNLAQLSTCINSNILSNRIHPSICFSRSLDFAKTFLRTANPRNISDVRCVLELNKSKLSSNYKIYPVSDSANMGSISRRSRRMYDSKSEERCDTPIKNLANYIDNIYIHRSILNFAEGQDVLDSIASDGFSYKLYN